MHDNGCSAAKSRKAKGSTTNHLINGVGNQANGLSKREATKIVDEIVLTHKKLCDSKECYQVALEVHKNMNNIRLLRIPYLEMNIKESISEFLCT